MSPAANLAHVLLCIQDGKDNDFKEWHNAKRSTLKRCWKGQAASEHDADGDDSGFVEGDDEINVQDG